MTRDILQLPLYNIETRLEYLERHLVNDTLFLIRYKIKSEK